MRAGLLILLVTIAAAIVSASEARDFPPPSTVKPSLVPWIARAEHHEKTRQLQEAISDYKEIIRLDPHTLLWSASLATLFEETRQYDKAIGTWSNVLEVEPTNFSARFMRARLHALVGSHDKAMADASELIRQHPNRAGGYTLRAAFYNDKHDYQKAIADANRALQIEPRNVAACSDAYLARANAFLHLKRYNQAVADLLEAIKVDPKSSDAFNSLAWWLATCPDGTVRNGTKATEYINRALKLDPNKSAFWDTRAAVFAENGDFKNAVSWEERYLQRKDLFEAERRKATERLALYHAQKPYRHEPE
jgi:tetratricopeptide (TPR) repeat protein